MACPRVSDKRVEKLVYCRAVACRLYSNGSYGNFRPCQDDRDGGIRERPPDGELSITVYAVHLLSVYRKALMCIHREEVTERAAGGGNGGAPNNVNGLTT